MKYVCVLVLVLFCVGCALTPNTTTDISEDATAVAKSVQRTGPPIVAGEGSTITMGDDVVKALVQERFAALGIDAQVDAKWTSKSPLSLLLYGVGFIVLVAGGAWAIVYAIKKAKKSAAIGAALGELDRQGEALVLRKAGTNDAAEDARLGNQIADLTARRRNVVNGVAA